MNDDELLALAKKLYDQGLGDDEVDEHLRRAMMGQGTDETISGPAAFGMGLASSTAGDVSADLEPEHRGRMAKAFAPQSGIGRGINQTIEEQMATSDAAQTERPGAHFLGAITPAVMDMGGSLAASAPSLLRGAGRLLRTGKEYAGATKLGRAYQRAGRSTPPSPAPSPNRYRGFEEPPQGSFPAIEGTGGGRTTFGMSVGEARAANAPMASAREHAVRAPVVAGTSQPMAGGAAAERSAAARASKATAQVEAEIAAGTRTPKGNRFVSGKDPSGKYRAPKARPSGGLNSPEAKRLSTELNELLKQNMAK